jgi:hypothetical protein
MKWGATTTSSVVVGLATGSEGSTIDVTLTGATCGAIDEEDETWTISSCLAPGSVEYNLHVAPQCLSVWRDVQSTPVEDGSYTETISAALLRY